MPTVTAAATATALPRQLSDQNPNGTVLGASATDKIGFFGNLNTTAVVQPTDASQIVPVLGAQMGSVTSYSTQQSPTAVTLNTVLEKAMTVMGGTGFNIQLLTTDMIFAVNKPTAQAGLWMGNTRISGSNVAQVAFGNATGLSITPTASQNYSIVGVRGVPSFTVTLSPASVAANTTAEQQFTLTGLTAGNGIPAGYLLQVSKPTTQTGLDIVGCRVVSSNVIGITFANATAAAILPTASEAYTVWALNGIDALNNDIYCQLNVDTPGAVGAGIVITGGNVAFNGVLATDSTTGIYKPTAQAVATNASIPCYCIPTANVLTLEYFSVGTGLTPTASEVYGIRLWRQAPTAPMTMFSPSLAPVSVAANTTAEQTFTVTGLVANSVVWLNKPTWQAGLGIGGVRVSALNTLAINYINLTSAAIVPATEIYTLGNFQAVVPSVSTAAAAQSVSQAFGAAEYQRTGLLRQARSSLVNLGLLKGS